MLVELGSKRQNATARVFSSSRAVLLLFRRLAKRAASERSLNCLVVVESAVQESS